MRVYAIWNGKGGIGKTTTAINLAYNLSVKGKKILAIDLDPQTNLTPFFVKANENGHTIRDVFSKTCIDVNRCIYRSKYPNIDVIKGNTRLTEDDADNGDDILKYTLLQVKDIYDVVIIDCRPSFEALTRNALCASDILMTPIQLDGYCKDNLSLVQRTYEEIRFDYPELKWMVFANKVKPLKTSFRIYSELITEYDYPLVSTCISERAAVMSASELKKPLLRHRKYDAATKDFLSLTKEVLQEEDK